MPNTRWGSEMGVASLRAFLMNQAFNQNAASRKHNLRGSIHLWRQRMKMDIFINALTRVKNGHIHHLNHNHCLYSVVPYICRVTKTHTENKLSWNWKMNEKQKWNHSLRSAEQTEQRRQFEVDFSPWIMHAGDARRLEFPRWWDLYRQAHQHLTCPACHGKNDFCLSGTLSGRPMVGLDICPLRPSTSPSVVLLRRGFLVEGLRRRGLGAVRADCRVVARPTDVTVNPGGRRVSLTFTEI